MIIHAHPIEDRFDSLDRQLSDFIEEVSRRSYYRFSKTATWQPAVNIYEGQAHFYLCVDLAGLVKDDVEVQVIGHTIRIRGARPVPQPAPVAGEPRCVLRIEIDSGPFERTIDLPETANTDNVEAKLQDGFLWITVNKRQG
jgi:HSP20 family protein